jgi:hypothetical protein
MSAAIAFSTYKNVYKKYTISTIKIIFKLWHLQALVNLRMSSEKNSSRKDVVF